jgi:hypothetical protein
MRSATMVFGAPTRRTQAWRVYQIRTANSLYELEVQEAGEPRRCTVLTRLDAQGAALQCFEDSQPRIGERCLYDVSALEWIGQPLAVGTACTTPVVSVDFLRNAPVRTQHATPASASQPVGSSTMVFGAKKDSTREPAREPRVSQQQPPPPAWSAFPLGSVEMVEAAANVLAAVCHRQDLLEALEGNTLLAKRYRLALAQCGLMLETLNNRQDGPA